MKKLALILALMLVPCTAFGLEMLTDNALDTVTGQSGVSIAADDVQIFLNVERIAWIDCDGYGSLYFYGGDCESTLGGALYLDNFQMDTLNINMIGARGDAFAVATGDGTGSGGHQTIDGGTPALAGSNCGMVDLFYNYGSDATGACMLTSTLDGGTNTLGLNHYTNTNFVHTLSGFLAKSITIDATSKLPLHTAGWYLNHGAQYGATSSQTIGGVLIGLPTMEIYIHSMTMTPRFTSDISGNVMTTACYNNRESFGTIEMQGITFSLLGGFMEIAPIGSSPTDSF